MTTLDTVALASVTGGQLAGCPVINRNDAATVTPDGGASTQLGYGESTIVPPGGLSVGGVGGSVRETCTPGTSFIVQPPNHGYTWGVGRLQS